MLNYIQRDQPVILTFSGTIMQRRILMNLRDKLNKYYYDNIVWDLRQLSQNNCDELSYNSIMYLDIISFQEKDGGCTVSSLAKTLNVSNSAATMKVNELTRAGLVNKTRSQQDKRVMFLSITDTVKEVWEKYDSPFERAVSAVEKDFTEEEIKTFITILDTFLDKYTEVI